MKDSTPEINWQGFTDGSAIREAVINRIHRELLPEPTGGPEELGFLGLFRHRPGYPGSLALNHPVRERRKK